MGQSTHATDAGPPPAGRSLAKNFILKMKNFQISHLKLPFLHGCTGSLKARLGGTYNALGNDSTCEQFIHKLVSRAETKCNVDVHVCLSDPCEQQCLPVFLKLFQLTWI